jgi:DNA invertase Pin-like site-specific DNA recombinase
MFKTSPKTMRRYSICRLILALKLIKRTIKINIMKKAIAIIRTKNKSGRGNRDQFNKIIRFISENNIVVVRFHWEEGVEGKNLNRHEWKKTMRFINQNPNEVDSIIVTQYDRILDDFHGTAYLMRRLKPLGIRIFSIEETIHDDDPIHKEKYIKKQKNEKQRTNTKIQ